ncbi:hypothetical protein B566_EDAN013393 [Ephemera danica]|nr:hypothetical protein B566_EDAN013393 [Ephemera danica]
MCSSRKPAKLPSSFSLQNHHQIHDVTGLAQLGTPLVVRLEAVRRRRRQAGIRVNLRHLSPCNAATC